MYRRAKPSYTLAFALIFALLASASAGADAAEVLDPNKYFGHAKLGYAAAKQCPEICAKLFCYCGCDETDEHDTLLDCFTTDHGVDCHICQQEALVALKMKREGKTLAEIQQAVDQQFEKQYPFDQVSAKFQKYKDSRLYKATDKKPGAASTPTKDGLSKADLKVGQPGKSSGSATSAKGKAPGCCGGKARKP